MMTKANLTLEPDISSLQVAAPTYRMLLCLLFSDAIALVLAAVISVEGRLFFDGQFHPSLYWSLWPALILFLLAYALAGVYPGIPNSPAEELRRLTLATTLIYLMMGAVTFILRGGEIYSRAIFLIAWVFSLFAVPMCRGLTRYCYAAQHWWGYPALILGAGRTGKLLVKTLHRQPGIGLKPVAILDDDPSKHGMIEEVPVMGSLERAPLFAQAKRVSYVIVAMPGVSRHRLLEIVDSYCQSYPHILIIPDMFGFSSLWVKAKDLGGVLGFEMCQRLLLPSSRIIKRIVDLTLTIVGGLAILPFIALLALAIKLDSPGRVFYGHQRIGQGGRRFKAWKFRSMVSNADKILQEYLEKDPQLRQEWAETQKLKDDPRITRVGQFLRKTSLDELPQLWNVLWGEMSLVGPRPIVQDEIVRYGDKFTIYSKVMSGMTGLWQISGRSEVGYEERVSLDCYYVRNWSVWLDLYILARTVRVVLTGKGAY